MTGVTTVTTGTSGTYNLTAQYILAAVVEKMQADGFNVAMPTGGEEGDSIVLNYMGRLLTPDTLPENYGILTYNDDTSGA